MTYHSQCLNATGPEKKTNKCGKIKVRTQHFQNTNGFTIVIPKLIMQPNKFQVGNVVDFKIEIEVTSCPADPKDWYQTLQIYPVGLNESLIVDIEMLCSCPCERPGNPVLKMHLH